jgi:hypothetical protein
VSQPTPASSAFPPSHERVIDAIVQTLTPEQASQIVREALSARLAGGALSDLLNIPTADRPHSKRVAKEREPKDYLGEIVDVTVVSVDQVKANMARIIFRDARGTGYLWDATSAKGMALKAGDKRRITATVLGREGGHVHIGRVRFYEKGAKPPLRFTR